MLWALIALPTLTVLIGAIGDTVSSFVNWYTEWIGNHTVNIVHLFKAIFARRDKDEVKTAAKKVAKDHENSGMQENGGKEADNGFRDIAAVEQQCTVPVDFDMDGLTDMEVATAEETYKPFMIIKAA